MNKISILQITNTLDLGGVERNIHNICKYVKFSMFDHVVVSIYKKGLFSKHISEYAKIYNLDGDINKLNTIINDCSIDVVIVHRAGKKEKHWCEILRLCSENGIKLILEFNVFGLHDNSEEAEFIDIHLHKSITSYLKYMKSVKNEKFKKYSDKHRVNYNLIEISKFNTMKLNHTDINKKKSSLGIGGDSLVLLRVGRPDVRKWGDLILYAIPKIVKRIPNVKFIFMSAPISRINYIKDKWYSENVIFLNNTSDNQELAEIYSIADIYIHSSRRGESFGQTLTEAFAFKLPIVVNSTPWKDNAQIELVDHMENGIIANTVDCFTEAVFYLFENPDTRIKFGENGFKKALEIYEADKVGRSLSKIILGELQHKGVEVCPLLKCFDSIDIYPSKSEITEYLETGYNERLQNTWESKKPKRPGSLMNTIRWSVCDIVDVLSHKLGGKYQ